MNCKKGFILYFDNLHCIRDLSNIQRGLLFQALAGYAMAAAEGGVEDTIAPAEMAARFSDMDPATVMAYSFIAETIRRDTLKWKEKQRHYSDAAKERERERRSREEVLLELRNPQPKDWRR